ncbi:hypothetical protein SLS62_002153 [Diatrype stigma]|uniref:Uncharacterized protein n=1 Tax=Diatrype stigma TaxID=117547 RepID=A0AAN9UYE5_9PEZI
MAAESGAEPAAVATPVAPSTYRPRYIDIGINLADPIFRGIYHGTQRHPDDLSAVISRAKEVGCQKLIVTGSDLQSSRDALEIAKEYPGTVYTTAGIHPCSSAIFGSNPSSGNGGSSDAANAEPGESEPGPEPQPDAARTASIISELEALIASARNPPSSPTSTSPNQEKKKKKKSPLVALGEFGLDYDRLHYSPRALQLHAFGAQLDLALRLSPPLPLFLHSRAAHGDFVSLLKAKFGSRLEGLLGRGAGAVVHSFTGTAAELRELLDLGLHIGVNGCSLKTAENCDVVRGAVGLGKIMLETDGPWCEIRPSHEGWRYLVEAAKHQQQSAAAGAAAADSAGNAGPPVDLVAPTPPSAATPEFTTAPSETPSGTSTPASASASGATVALNTSAIPAQKQKQQQKSRKKQPPPKKKEPEVPERFPAVKKEKWAEGAMVKSRNEPCMIERVATAVAGIKGVAVEELCEAAWRNTVAVFDVLEEGEEEKGKGEEGQ